MSNLMINTPATQYSPLTTTPSAFRTEVTPSFKRPLVKPIRSPIHAPFLTSEVVPMKKMPTAEQDLSDYIQKAYP